MNSQDDKTVTVVRIIRYTGSEEAVRACLSKSLAPGIHQRVGYDITVSTHISDLPEVDYLCPAAVADTLSKTKPVVEPSGEVGTSEPGPFIRALEDFLKEGQDLENPSYTRPKGCCCPPPGHKGSWAAGMCPVHQGLRRTLNPMQKHIQEQALRDSRDE